MSNPKLTINGGRVKITSDLQISHYINCETSISFSDLGLGEVDGEIPEGITDLWLDGNKLQDLKSLRFPRFPNTVKSIFLTNNIFSSTKNLANIPDNVEVLFLNDNRIEEVDGEHLPKKLKTLILAGNKVKKMVNMERLKDLSTLHLGDNKLKEIKEEWLSPNLRYIRLEKNEIEDVSQINWPSKCEYIFLNLNKITSFENLKLRYTLKELTLTGNPLEVNGVMVKQGGTIIWT